MSTTVGDVPSMHAALGLSPGQPLTLLTAAGPRAMTVVGAADGPGFYVSNNAAARLAPPRAPRWRRCSGRFLVRAGLENADLVVRVQPTPIVVAVALGVVVALCGAW